jgi:acetyl-CoA acetyltransferase
MALQDAGLRPQDVDGIATRAMGLPRGQYHAAPGAEVSGEAQYFAPYHLFAATQTHALAYQRYQRRYGAQREHMATLAVNSRENALRNEMAFFHDRPLTVEDYMSARMISSPLCLYDCDIPVFGAAAIVLCSRDRARDCQNAPAYVLGFGQQTSRQPRLGGSLYTLHDYMELGGRTASRVWESAGIGPKEVNVAELYDGFSPSVWYWLEAAGFCEEGEAFQFIQGGTIALDGDLPVNTFGGSLSEGRMHGMGHVIEAVRQVSGRAAARQVLGAEVAVVFDGSPMLRGSGLAVAGRAN